MQTVAPAAGGEEFRVHGLPGQPGVAAGEVAQVAVAMVVLALDEEEQQPQPQQGEDVVHIGFSLGRGANRVHRAVLAMHAGGRGPQAVAPTSVRSQLRCQR